MIASAWSSLLVHGALSRSAAGLREASTAPTSKMPLPLNSTPKECLHNPYNSYISL